MYTSDGGSTHQTRGRTKLCEGRSVTDGLGYEHGCDGNASDDVACEAGTWSTQRTEGKRAYIQGERVVGYPRGRGYVVSNPPRKLGVLFRQSRCVSRVGSCTENSLNCKNTDGGHGPA